MRKFDQKVPFVARSWAYDALRYSGACLLGLMAVGMGSVQAHPEAKAYLDGLQLPGQTLELTLYLPQDLSPDKPQHPVIHAGAHACALTNTKHHHLAAPTNQSVWRWRYRCPTSVAVELQWAPRPYPTLATLVAAGKVTRHRLPQDAAKLSWAIERRAEPEPAAPPIVAKPVPPPPPSEAAPKPHWASPLPWIALGLGVMLLFWVALRRR